MSCLDTLVGLSKTVPPCFTDAAPAGYDTSTSGYYLNDADFGFQILDKCNFNGWSLFKSALESGILRFKSDLRGSIYTKHDKKGQGFTGVIGKINFTGTQHISASKTRIGHLIRVKEDYKGLTLKLKKLYLGLDAAGTYVLKINSNDPDFTEIITEISCDGQRFTPNVLDDQISLPMYSKFDLSTGYVRGAEYYLTIEHGDARPLYSNFECCGSGAPWEQWFYVQGMSCTDDIGTNADLSGYTTGLCYEAFLDCDDIGWICNLSEMNGYDALDVCARAVQFVSSSIAIDQFLMQGIVNSCTLYNRQDLRTQQKFLQTKYGEYQAYIVENIPVGISDCFTCKQGDYFKTVDQIV